MYSQAAKCTAKLPKIAENSLKSCLFGRAGELEQPPLFWAGTAASVPDFLRIRTDLYDKWYDPYSLC
jgi:hypothetical protein